MVAAGTSALCFKGDQRLSCRCAAHFKVTVLQDSEAGQMTAPDELAREETELRAQREEVAKKAFKVSVIASHQHDMH